MRRRNAKISLLLAAFVLFSLVFSGCGSSSQNNSGNNSTSIAASTTASSNQASTATPKEKVKIKFWQRSSGSGGPVVDFLKAYNASQNDVEVGYSPYGENYFNGVDIALAGGGDPPEIFEAQNNPSVVTLTEAGNIVSIDDLITSDYKLKKNIELDESVWVYYKDKDIPAIVSEELWNRAHTLLVSRGKVLRTGGAEFHNRYPYSGKIICEEHGTSFHHQVLHSKKGDKEI